VSVLSSLDSDDPGRALNRAAIASLDLFTTVNKRIDSAKPTANAAGAVVSEVWRWGLDANGSIVGCNAVGVSGDYYWIFSYHGTMPAPGTKDAKLLADLVKAMSVELLQ
jgi:hypothetical protein